MMKVFKFLFVFIFSVVFFSSCVTHIAYYHKKHRKIKEISVKDPVEKLSEGSLWTKRGAGTSLFSEKKAHKINDIIQVIISENDIAQKTASTKLKRKGETAIGLSNFLGLWEKALKGDSDLSAKSLIKASSKNDFDGNGNTARKESMTAVLSVKVKKVFRSGNLFIEGEKVTMLNKEEQHFYISGIIRPEDITTDNTILSSRISDLQVEYTGRGVISDKQSPGFLSRLVDLVWPF